MPDIAFANGRFISLAEAFVPIEDRGFQFGDGVYEGIAAYGHTIFRLADHLARLHESLRAVRIALPYSDEQLRQVMEEGVARSGYERTFVYLQITRGVAPRNHLPNIVPEPTVIATFKAMPERNWSRIEGGVSVCTMQDIRWERCHIKTVALLPSVIAKMETRDRGFDDCVFVGSDGALREASASNIFLIDHGKLRTPELSPHLLSGVTRSFIIEVAKELGVPVDEATLGVEELEAADEAFLSSTTIEILPVTRVNDRAIGKGSMGPTTRRLYDAFLERLPKGFPMGTLSTPPPSVPIDVSNDSLAMCSASPVTK